ncbi:HCP-like protein [Rhizophagus irregularis]|nr:HCP-like protein [Rhizophagus irregularis]
MFDENLPALLEDKSLDLDGSKAIDDIDDDDEFVLPDDFTVPAIPLDEGIQAHKKGEYQKAWNCFEYHAKNGNTLAKCWKGRYLWDGYLDGIKERDDGRKLLKEAADEGHADAQLFYAFTLKKSMNEGKNIDTFIDYITKAAKGNNEVAQYNLGDIYYKGKLNIPKDEKEGIRWLKMAALRDNTRAIKLLNEKGIKYI